MSNRIQITNTFECQRPDTSGLRKQVTTIIDNSGFNFAYDNLRYLRYDKFLV